MAANETGAACPFCLWVLEDPDEPTDDEPITCPSCATAYHADCWTESGGCTTFGCDAWAERLDVEAAATRAAPVVAARYAPPPPQLAARPALGGSAHAAAGTVLAAVCPECGFAIAHGTRKCPYCWLTIDWDDR